MKPVWNSWKCIFIHSPWPLSKAWDKERALFDFAFATVKSIRCRFFDESVKKLLQQQHKKKIKCLSPGSLCLLWFMQVKWNQLQMAHLLLGQESVGKKSQGLLHDFPQGECFYQSSRQFIYLDKPKSWSLCGSAGVLNLKYCSCYVHPLRGSIHLPIFCILSERNRTFYLNYLYLKIYKSNRLL